MLCLSAAAEETLNVNHFFYLPALKLFPQFFISLKNWTFFFGIERAKPTSKNEEPNTIACISFRCATGERTKNFSEGIIEPCAVARAHNKFFFSVQWWFTFYLFSSLSLPQIFLARPEPQQRMQWSGFTKNIGEVGWKRKDKALWDGNKEEIQFRVCTVQS